MTSRLRGQAAVLLLLSLLVLAVYGRTWGYSFVYDDAEYVTGNPVVREGITAGGLAAAWTKAQAMNWHPLTILSHMADVELFGLDPGPPHLVNAALHLAVSFLLFLLLNSLTGWFAASAFAAAIFAVHPLHVEPVAWISGRKDLLCALFWFASTGAYVRYARGGGAPAYLVSSLLFVAALLSKPMAVTLPFTLLLLDVWPLRRISGLRPDPGDFAEGDPPAAPPVPLRRALLEKVPLLALAALFSLVTLSVQERAMPSTGGYPFPLRAANAVVSIAAYAGKAVLPVRLSPLYPHPAETGGDIPAWKVIVSLSVICAATFTALWGWRRRPFLAVGWLFFLCTLVPVLGLVQVGSQAMADRYMYVPLTGLLIGGVALADYLVRRRGERAWRGACAAGCAATLALAAAAYVQAGYWKDGETLWRRALAVTEDNGGARNNLADALMAKGRDDEAMLHLREAVRLQPGNADAWSNVARILASRGMGEEAERAARNAVELRPWDDRPWGALGMALLAKGDGAGAVRPFREAVKRKPLAPEGWYNLGIAQAAAGYGEWASSSYREAIRLRPGFPKAWNNLGNVLSSGGKESEAVACFREAVRLSPDYRAAWHNLALSARAAGRPELAAEAEERERFLSASPDAEGGKGAR